MTRIDSPEMQLLELLRRSDLPTATDRDRIRRNVALQVAAGASLATALVAAEHSSWFAKIWAASGWFKAATVAATLAAAAGGVTAVISAKTTRPPPVDATAPAVQVRSISRQETKNPSAAAEPKLDAPAESAPASVRAGSAAPKSSARAATASLEAELELIGQAQRALKAGRAQDALRALDEHQRRFPAGSLSFERAGVRPIALCQAGNVEEGRAAARNYLRRLPNSVLSKRIRVACHMTDE
jgi:hypothetical protein